MIEEKTRPKNEIDTTEITSVISHQLKTPLAGIKSSLELILSGDLGELNADQREYLTLTLEASEKSIRLIRNLLDVSRIGENKFAIDVSLTDMKKLVQSVIDDVVLLARAKNSSVELIATEKLPLINADPIKIQQVVRNIIDNAIHYTKGKGKVIVKLERVGNNVKFSCEDQGIGISEEDAAKLFTKFFRGSDSSELTTDGTGMGLFISKAIIELSGGKIWFESEKNKGSIFYFTLPI